MLLRGFPAHAGIDPRTCTSDKRPKVPGFPRPRGDRPFALLMAGSSTIGWGFPAHAGIDPSPPTPGRRQQIAGFPATRG